MMQLITGEDINFENIYIHQPTLKELSSLGDENNFFLICQLLISAKEILQGQERIDQDEIDDFDIVMTILSRQVPQLVGIGDQIFHFLNLLFPEYQKQFSQQQAALILKKDATIGSLNKINYQIFVKLLKQMFCLEQFLGEQMNSNGFNPAGEQAKRIAEQLMRRRLKIEQRKQPHGEIGLLNRFCSILIVGLGFSWSEISNFTIYQLLDTYKRFTMKEDYDAYIDAKMLGAKDIKEVPHWRASFEEAEKQIKKQEKTSGRGKKRGSTMIIE